MIRRIDLADERTPPRAPHVTGTREARLVARITGQVQGVGYRYFVQAEASRLGLGGSVRNLADGAVRVEAEGPRPSLLDLVERLRQGPPAARVQRVDVEWHPPHGDAEFRILAG